VTTATSPGHANNLHTSHHARKPKSQKAASAPSRDHPQQQKAVKSLKLQKNGEQTLFNY
jgi:hypothetical protein